LGREGKQKKKTTGMDEFETQGKTGGLIPRPPNHRRKSLGLKRGGEKDTMSEFKTEDGSEETWGLKKQKQVGVEKKTKRHVKTKTKETDQWGNGNRGWGEKLKRNTVSLKKSMGKKKGE